MALRIRSGDDTDTAAGPSQASQATEDVVRRIGDGLFEVRCLAEDLHTALSDGAESSDLAAIVQELIIKTREVERFIP